MSYRYLSRLHFLVRFKNRPITRTAIFFNIYFILKTLDLRFLTSGDELQNYNSVDLNFLHEKIVSAPQNKINPKSSTKTRLYSKSTIFVAVLWGRIGFDSRCDCQV